MEIQDVVDKSQNLGITSIGADVFGRIWADAGEKDLGTVSRAYSFRRTAGQAGLVLAPAVPRPRAQGDIVWTIFPNHADFAATLQLSSSGEDVSLVEVSLPVDIILADVRGPALHHWSRQSTGVQIWLHQPHKQAVLELTGWGPLAHTATGAKAGLFVLPPLQVLSARLDSLQIKVLPSEGMAIAPERLHQLIKDPAPNTY